MGAPLDPDGLLWLDDALGRARASLLDRRGDAGHWRGELSSSALSTSTAVAALAGAAGALPVGSPERADLQGLAERGRAWLAANPSPDGGFGDTTDSPSNLSTTALAWMALGPGLGLPADEAVERAWTRADGWLREALGGARPDSTRLAAALEEIYGEDRTFAVPILAACTIGGAFAEDPDPWRVVRPLPFEVAALPQGLFRFLGLPVVSYALPALIAIGQGIAHHRPSRNPVARLLRRALAPRTLRVLTGIQPENGGFLEATPLTSFVTLSLVAIGEVQHQVVSRGLSFLRASVRADGSWPIDTDLATWGTTLSVGALGAGFEGAERIKGWLLDQQHTVRHPFTGAAPGGWAWTDLPGGVPDADDTPGALIALRLLEGDTPSPGARAAAAAGLRWLVDLQNRDGGIPTFCRGWGRLPFDQSCADLTAHPTARGPRSGSATRSTRRSSTPSTAPAASCARPGFGSPEDPPRAGGPPSSGGPRGCGPPRAPTAASAAPRGSPRPSRRPASRSRPWWTSWRLAWGRRVTSTGSAAPPAGSPSGPTAADRSRARPSGSTSRSSGTTRSSTRWSSPPPASAPRAGSWGRQPGVDASEGALPP